MKLVRDNVPALHPEHTYKTARPEDMELMLRLKVVEEAAEVAGVRNRQELVEELGDVLDVIATLLMYAGIQPEEIEESQARKMARLGGFGARRMLSQYIPKEGA